MYNKRKFNKINDKKVLHKVKKQWVTISLALFMMIGGGVVASSMNVSANSNNNQKPQIHVQTKPKHNRNITTRAKVLHNHLMNNATKLVANNHKVVKQVPQRHNNKIVNLSNRPAKKINSVNQLNVNHVGSYKGNTYQRVNIPFRNLKITHKVLLHSNIQSVGSTNHILGALYRGKIVKASKAFKGYFNKKSYLRYEVPLTHKRSAFITGNDDYINYVAPTTNYRYYQRKINHILKHSHNKSFNKIRRMANKFAKRENKNYRTYMRLYVYAYNTQQSLRHPVDFMNRKSHKATAKRVNNNNEAQPSLANSLDNNTNASSVPSSEAQSYSYALMSNVIPSYTPASFIPTPSYTSSVASLSASASSNSVPVQPSSATSSSVSSSASSASVPSAKSSNVSSTSSNNSSKANSNTSKSSNANSNSAKSSSINSSASKQSVMPSSTASSSVKSNSASNNSSESSHNNTPKQPASNSQSSSNNNVVPNKPSSSNSNDTPSSNSTYKYGNYRGLNYKYNPITKALEFTDGTAYSDLSKFIINASSDIKDATSIKFSNNINTSHVTNMSYMFKNDYYNSNLQTLDLGNNFNTKNVTNMSYMFGFDSDLKSLTLPESFNTNNVTNMRHMFDGDRKLQSLTLPNAFNTSKVTDMRDMFDSDSTLKSLALPKSFNTSNVTTMRGMFYNDYDLQSLILPNSFNTSNVITMEAMFTSDHDLQSLTIQSSLTKISDRQGSDSLPTMYNESEGLDKANDFSKGNVGTFITKNAQNNNSSNSTTNNNKPSDSNNKNQSNDKHDLSDVKINTALFNEIKNKSKSYSSHSLTASDLQTTFLLSRIAHVVTDPIPFCLGLSDESIYRKPIYYGGIGNPSILHITSDLFNGNPDAKWLKDQISNGKFTNNKGPKYDFQYHAIDAEKDGNYYTMYVFSKDAVKSAFDTLLEFSSGGDSGSLVKLAQSKGQAEGIKATLKGIAVQANNMGQFTAKGITKSALALIKKSLLHSLLLPIHRPYYIVITKSTKPQSNPLAQ